MRRDVVQPVQSVLNDLSKSEDIVNRFATRQWSLAAKQLRQAFDKVLAVAEDEGHVTLQAVHHYSTSCTFTTNLLSVYI